MKYNYLLLISALVPVILSTMEIKRSSSLTKEALTKWIYREKTVITISDQPNNSHDVSIESTDQDNTSNINDTTENTNEKSPRKDQLTKQKSFERY